MVTGNPHPPPDPIHAFPPTAAPSHPVAFSPPSKRDLASWWRQFKRNTRKDEAKGTWRLGGLLDFFGHLEVPGFRLPLGTIKWPSFNATLLDLRRAFFRLRTSATNTINFFWTLASSAAGRLHATVFSSNCRLHSLYYLLVTSHVLTMCSSLSTSQTSGNLRRPPQR